MPDFYFDTLIFDNSAPLADRVNACEKQLKELSKFDSIPIYGWAFEYKKKIIMNKLEELLNDNK